MRSYLSKILLVILAIMLFIPAQLIQVFAVSVGDTAYLERGDKGFYSVQYLNSGEWMYITYSRTFYTDEQGVRRIAYCLDSDLKGIGWINGEVSGYNVSLTEALSNERLWRVYRHGYPYVSPADLGVETEDDAYLATKQAGYWVIANRPLNDVYNYYRAGQERVEGESMEDIQRRGQKVVDAIYKLVNLGYNGTETPQVNNLINVNKSGEFEQFGNTNCYSQNYSVTSTTGMTEYTIENLTDFPSGTYVADLNGQSKNTFSAGEQFKIMIPVDSITSNINGKIAVRGKCQTYPIFYGKAPDGKQNYAVTTDSYTDYAETVVCSIEANISKIKLIKRDSETKNPIANVEFNFKYEDGQNIGNYRTDENGEIYLEKLKQGNVIITEVKANDNYILDTEEHKITLGYNQVTNVELENEHKQGNLKIYKVDKDNHEVALGNVQFDLYSEEYQKVVGTYTTNVNGEIEINDLRIGNYKLIEKNTGKWYNLADDKEVKIKWNTTEDLTIENELKKGQIKIIKVDKDNNEVKLAGVTFEVLDENNKILEQLTTDKNGEVLTSKYPIRDYNKLKIREKTTLETYVLSKDVKTVELKENQISTIKFENEKKKAQIKVIKVDKDNKEVKLENVKFDIVDKNGQVVDTIITDKNGEATTKRIPIDSEYTIIERETKKEYKLTEETQTVKLEQDEIKNITFKNEKRKGQLRIIKVDLDDNEVLLEGVTFDILDEDENVVDTVVTNENGEATTKPLPCVDKEYTVVERETRKEYVLTEETQTIELKEDEITSITFENEKVKGYLEITKVDSKTKETLEGATFGVYDESNKEIAQLTTDETGKAKSELLPYGKYYAKELSTGSVYYLLNEDTFEFEIIKNYEIVPLTIDNDSVDIKVTVDKEGTTEIKPGEKVNYEFSNVGNASNVYLENFKWFDYIPTDYVKLETMTTGIWNQDLTYDVYYKTNKSDNYILFRQDLKTTENYDLDFTEIEFTEDEYIVQTMFDFGKVNVGFKEDIKPTMECKSFDTLKENDTFTNYTKTIGTYFGITAEANSKWTTITHTPKEIHEVKLPRTGK